MSRFLGIAATCLIQFGKTIGSQPEVAIGRTSNPPITYYYLADNKTEIR